MLGCVIYFEGEKRIRIVTSRFILLCIVEIEVKYDECVVQQEEDANGVMSDGGRRGEVTQGGVHSLKLF